MESSECDVACSADGPPMQSSLDDDHVQSSILARCKSWMQPLTRGTTTKLENVITENLEMVGLSCAHSEQHLRLQSPLSFRRSGTALSPGFAPGAEMVLSFYLTVSQRTMPHQAHTVRVEMKRTCSVRSFFLSERLKP